MAFEIIKGSAPKACTETRVVLPHPCWNVIEKRGSAVIAANRFWSDGEAHGFIQSALYADRCFALEGR